MKSKRQALKSVICFLSSTINSDHYHYLQPSHVLKNHCLTFKRRRFFLELTLDAVKVNLKNSVPVWHFCLYIMYNLHAERARLCISLTQCLQNGTRTERPRGKKISFWSFQGQTWQKGKLFFSGFVRNFHTSSRLMTGLQVLLESVPTGNKLHHFKRLPKKKRQRKWTVLPRQPQVI